MSKKVAKTRIVITANDETRILASIRQEPDGKLLIFPATHLRQKSEYNDIVPIKSQKYTIHRNLNSPQDGNTIHHTLENQYGPPYETHAFTKCIVNGLASRIYAHTFCNFYLDQQKNTIRPSDAIVSLGKYDPKSSTLHIIMLLHAANISNVIEQNDYYNTHTVTFEHFAITILSSFSQHNSNPNGHMVHYHTSTTTMDLEKGAKYEQWESPGNTPVELMLGCIQSFRSLHTQSCEQSRLLYKQYDLRPVRIIDSYIDDEIIRGPTRWPELTSEQFDALNEEVAPLLNEAEFRRRGVITTKVGMR